MDTLNTHTSNVTEERSNSSPPKDKKIPLKSVQMRFTPKTIRNVAHLKRLTGIRNRTQIVSAAIQLTDAIISEINKDGKLCIERSDGSVDYITIVGL